MSVDLSAPTVYDIRSTTVVVSGFPVVHAVTLYCNGVKVMTTTDYRQVQPFLSPQKVQCGGCHRYALIMDQRLGVRLCTTCSVHYSSICIQRHARLPRMGEFWCKPCGKILHRDQLCKRESAGYQRWSCQGCRASRLKQNAEKRKLHS